MPVSDWLDFLPIIWHTFYLGSLYNIYLFIPFNHKARHTPILQKQSIKKGGHNTPRNTKIANVKRGIMIKPINNLGEGGEVRRQLVSSH